MVARSVSMTTGQGDHYRRIVPHGGDFPWLRWIFFVSPWMPFSLVFKGVHFSFIRDNHGEHVPTSPWQPSESKQSSLPVAVCCCWTGSKAVQTGSYQRCRSEPQLHTCAVCGDDIQSKLVVSTLRRKVITSSSLLCCLLTFSIQKMGNILADFVHSFRPAAQMVTVSSK